MANLAHKYGILPFRTTRADGRATTFGAKLADYIAIKTAFPNTKARVAAILALSLEFDRLHPDAPRNRKLSRSSFIRDGLLRPPRP